MNVDHVVLAHGYPWKNSSWPGQVCLSCTGQFVRVGLTPQQSEFQGQIIHSSAFRHAGPFVGKKVIVIGACTSGESIPT